MSSSAEVFKEWLEELFNSGKISKIEFHRRSEIPRPSIDGYLKGAVPDLNVLDRAAKAVNEVPWNLITPEHERSKTLEGLVKIVQEQEAKLFRLPDVSDFTEEELKLLREQIQVIRTQRSRRRILGKKKSDFKA